MRILLITTGGTIDGADLDTGARREKSALHQFLLETEGGGGSIEVDSHAPFNKDSRAINDADRYSILRIIEQSSADRVLVGHGTFTICETGRFLKSRLKDSCHVILVGAWIPFGEANSDAPEQAKLALQALKRKTEGVHIAMDGRLWNPDTTDKIEATPGKWRLADR